jgi:hypothetical protein
MRKIILFILVVFSIGCATRVPITYEKPATFNMSDYRHLIVEPVIPYRLASSLHTSGPIIDLSENSEIVVYPGYQTFSERLVANYATEKISALLGDGSYFKLDLQESSLQAALQSQISFMEGEEYVFVKKDANDTNRYYLRQRVRLSITYQVLNLKDSKIVYRKTISDSLEQTYQLDNRVEPIIFAPPLLPLYEQLVDTIAVKIVDSLKPKVVRTTVALMENKPFSPNAEIAYEAAKEKVFTVAYILFKEIWENEQHVPSGYNSSLLAESLGDREQALAIMNSVYRFSFDKKALKQISRMESYKKESALAQSQY